jgi:CheY-like chemotaxis protein/nitrogen-specific signal transduction histidine kinase
MRSRRRATRSVHRTEQLLGVVADNATDAIIVTDFDLRPIYCNGVAGTLFGRSPHRMLNSGHSLKTFVPVRDAAAFERELRGLSSSGGASADVNRQRSRMGLRADGSEFHMHTSLAASGAGRRRLYTLFACACDCLNQPGCVLQARPDRGQPHDTPLTRVGHELRAPLNGILGFADLMRSDSEQLLLGRQLEWVTHIADAGRHMLSLIDDLLGLSFAGPAATPLSAQAVNLGEVMRFAIRLLALLAAERRLSVDVAAGLELHWVHADPRACRQIALNLLSNALKYDRPGGRVMCVAKADHEFVHLRIEDSGVGMSELQLSQLFEPGNRLGAEHSEVSGAGLGLVISRDLAAAMGGSLRASSEQGVGSEFVLSLPASAAEPAVRRVGAKAGQSGRDAQLQALYIEDDPISALLMESVLGLRPDWTLTVCTSAAAGRDYCLTHLPDLVLTDLNLPDLSGTEVIQQLRADPRTHGLRIVSVSGDCQAAAGADAHWQKPLDIGLVMRELADIGNRMGGDGGHRPPSRTRP